jgi:hypothetical protein
VNVTRLPEVIGSEPAAPRLLGRLPFLAAVVLLAVSAAPADAATPFLDTGLYPAGQFPSGTIYREDQLASLGDQRVPNPSYLVGRFLCLENRPGSALFASYARSGDHLVFGKVVLSVTFFGNCPAGLHVGSVIAPDSRDPLTIKAVFHRNDLVVVTAESWSLPKKPNNN